MIHQRLQSFLQKRHCTLLGVGPMSVNCVDATIELANEHEVPILMIASLVVVMLIIGQQKNLRDTSLIRIRKARFYWHVTTVVHGKVSRKRMLN
jgi:hypothetical protein